MRAEHLPDWDSTQFNALLTATTYLATPGSEAKRLVLLDQLLRDALSWPGGVAGALLGVAYGLNLIPAPQRDAAADLLLRWGQQRAVFAGWVKSSDAFAQAAVSKDLWELAKIGAPPPNPPPARLNLAPICRALRGILAADDYRGLETIRELARGEGRELGADALHELEQRAMVVIISVPILRELQASLSHPPGRPYPSPRSAFGAEAALTLLAAFEDVTQRTFARLRAGGGNPDERAALAALDANMSRAVALLLAPADNELLTHHRPVSSEAFIHSGASTAVLALLATTCRYVADGDPLESIPNKVRESPFIPELAQATMSEVMDVQARFGKEVPVVHALDGRRRDDGLLVRVKQQPLPSSIPGRVLWTGCPFTTPWQALALDPRLAGIHGVGNTRELFVGLLEAEL